MRFFLQGNWAVSSEKDCQGALNVGESYCTSCSTLHMGYGSVLFLTSQVLLGILKTWGQLQVRDHAGNTSPSKVPHRPYGLYFLWLGALL